MKLLFILVLLAVIPSISSSRMLRWFSNHREKCRVVNPAKAALFADKVLAFLKKTNQEEQIYNCELHEAARTILNQTKIVQIDSKNFISFYDSIKCPSYNCPRPDTPDLKKFFQGREASIMNAKEFLMGCATRHAVHSRYGYSVRMYYCLFYLGESLKDIELPKSEEAKTIANVL